MQVRSRVHRIAVALVISGAVHGGVALFFSPEFNPASTSTRTDPTLHVSLAHKVLPAPAVTEPPDPQPDAVDSEALQTTETVARAPANPAVVAPTAQAARPSTPVISARTMLEQFRNSTFAQATQEYAQSDCSAKQRASGMFVCNDPRTASARALPPAIVLPDLPDRAVLTRHRLDAIAPLLAELHMLDELDVSNPAALAEVKTRRADLTREIRMRDAELASVNLLRLIPMTRRAISGLTAQP